MFKLSFVQAQIFYFQKFGSNKASVLKIFI